MTLTDKLKEDIRKFLKKSGMSKSMLGAKALGDHHAVFLLWKGKDFRLSTAQKFYDFMDGWEK